MRDICCVVTLQVILMGSDIPGLTPAIIKAAVRALDQYAVGGRLGNVLFLPLLGLVLFPRSLSQQ